MDRVDVATVRSTMEAALADFAGYEVMHSTVPTAHGYRFYLYRTLYGEPIGTGLDMCYALRGPLSGQGYCLVECQVGVRMLMVTVDQSKGTEPDMVVRPMVDEPGLLHRMFTGIM